MTTPQIRVTTAKLSDDVEVLVRLYEAVDRFLEAEDSFGAESILKPMERALGNLQLSYLAVRRIKPARLADEIYLLEEQLAELEELEDEEEEEELEDATPGGPDSMDKIMGQISAGDAETVRRLASINKHWEGGE